MEEGCKSAICVFLKSAGQLFFRLFFNLSLSDAFSWLDLEYADFGKNTTEITCFFPSAPFLWDPNCTGQSQQMSL